MNSTTTTASIIKKTAVKSTTIAVPSVSRTFGVCDFWRELFLQRGQKTRGGMSCIYICICLIVSLSIGDGDPIPSFTDRFQTILWIFLSIMFVVVVNNNKLVKLGKPCAVFLLLKFHKCMKNSSTHWWPLVSSLFSFSFAITWLGSTGNLNLPWIQEHTQPFIQSVKCGPLQSNWEINNAAGQQKTPLTPFSLHFPHCLGDDGNYVYIYTAVMLLIYS